MDRQTGQAALMPFVYQGRDIRVQVDGQGASWWEAKDVCAVLHLKNVSEALSRLKSSEKGIRISDTLGGQQEVLTINEPGLYRLIFRSSKPEAQAFQDWVFHEVLPTLRRTGRYDLKAFEDQKLRLQHEVRQLEAQREALSPITDGPRGVVIRHVCTWLDQLPEPQREVLHIMARQATVQHTDGAQLALLAGVLWQCKDQPWSAACHASDLLRHGRRVLVGEPLLRREWPTGVWALRNMAYELVALFYDWGYDLHVWPGKIRCTPR